MQGELSVAEGFPAPRSDIGIYVFISKSWKFYVGQSSQLNRRKYEHFRLLNKGEHTNSHLQRSYNKYGALAYAVIEYLDDTSILTEREQYWMDQLKAYDEGMNQTPAADSSLGCVRTEAQRAVTSAITKEYWGKEENRQAQSERKRKFFEDNPEHLVRMSEITKEKFIERPDLAEAHSAYMKGLSNTLEYKEAFTERMKNWRATLTPEESSALGKKSVKTKGPEARRLHALKARLTRVKSRKPRSHNKISGILGVSWTTGKTRKGVPRLDASARWTERDGTNKFKRFSVAKYGLLPAFKLAVLYREKTSQRLEAEYEAELAAM